MTGGDWVSLIGTGLIVVSGAVWSIWLFRHPRGFGCAGAVAYRTWKPRDTGAYAYPKEGTCR